MKKAQVWVETVIYTLIALVMISLVLAYAKPKIQEVQDKSTIDKTIEIMETIDDKIASTMQGGAGNKRIINLEINKGELVIDAFSDRINFTIKDSKSEYSEPGEWIQKGNLYIYTEKKGKTNNIKIVLKYENIYDLRYGGEDISKILSKGSSSISLSNEGNSKVNIEVN